MGEVQQTEWGEQPLTVLPGIGPKRAEHFVAAFGVATLSQLLRVLPRRYQQPAPWATSEQWPDGERVKFQGCVEKSWAFRPRGGRNIVTVRLADDFGTVDALFFQQPWLRGRFEPGETVSLVGKASTKRGRQLLSPRLWREDEGGGAEQGMETIYPEAAGLSAGQVAQAMAAALQSLDQELGPGEHFVDEPIPERVLALLDLPHLSDAWLGLHRPRDMDQIQRARRRLAFGEVLQLERRRRAALPEPRAAEQRTQEDAIWSRIRARTPFDWSEDQERVLATLREELYSGKVIRRLVHGEVGSGKTVVAFAMALAVAAQGRQAAILAPTEILARQHLRTFSEWLKGSKLGLVRLLGDDTAAMRRAALAALQSGRASIAIGTHALFGKEVGFADLGLVVLDEQHRFGVRQKASLVDKGEAPHVLTMTATPIPRTLAWAAYGALDPCVLRSRPGVAAPIHTSVHDQASWPERAEEFARRALAGEKLFLVAPRIDGEGGLKEIALELRAGPWAKLRCAVVHGRLAGAEIEAAVRAFDAGQLDALLGTTVVEVGLDVADVPQMAILGAERLGLASLHQLRGRLARGSAARAARCEIFAARDAVDRLKCLESCTDGFEVAELDLRQRGPGALRGLAQSGHGDFRVFDPSRDSDLVAALRQKEIRNWLDSEG